MKKFDVMATFEGKTKDFCDIVAYNGIDTFIIRDVPFFDKEGKEICYDEALGLYGVDGLEHDIWDSTDYVINLWRFFYGKEKAC